jgi:hypothetical protein
MRWIKATSKAQAKDKKKQTNLKDAEDLSNSRTVIVFNPLLWKEEIVNLIED